MHEISVIVASDADSITICTSLGTRRVRAKASWWIVPLAGVTKPLLGTGLSLPDLEDPALAPRLAEALAPLAEALARLPLRGVIVLAFTQYFGGVGAQAAAVMKDGAFVFGPVVKERAVNEALAHLGVQSDGERDLFDSVGLAEWRSMDDLAGAG